MHEGGVADMQKNALKFMVLFFFVFYPFFINICRLNNNVNAESNSYISEANFTFAICVLGNLGN